MGRRGEYGGTFLRDKTDKVGGGEGKTNVFRIRLGKMNIILSAVKVTERVLAGELVKGRRPVPIRGESQWSRGALEGDRDRLAYPLP